LPYGSNLDLPELHEASEWLNHRKRELENIMGSFPTSEMFNSFGRQSIALVTALLYAQCIDEDIFDSLIDYESGFTVPPRYLGWEFLLWQNGELPNDCESNFMGTSLPPFPWGKLLVPLWDKCTNWRVLQASGTLGINGRRRRSIPATPVRYWKVFAVFYRIGCAADHPTQ